MVTEIRIGEPLGPDLRRQYAHIYSRSCSSRNSICRSGGASFCRCGSRQLNASPLGIAGTFLFIVLTDPWIIPWTKMFVERRFGKPDLHGRATTTSIN